jgi:hypothetical protein
MMPGCALTQDFNLDCRDSIGGVKTIYLIEAGNISAVTEASGVVSAITKTAGSVFRKYSLIRDTSNATETLTVNEQNGTVFAAQAVEVIINKRQANTRNEIMLLAKNNISFVVVDMNGKAFLYGREFGLVLGAGVAATGTAWGDRNGYTLPFAGNEKELAPEVQVSVIATLQTPGT